MNDNILNKNIIEAIRSAYAAPTEESVASKSAERQGVMARTQSKINTALEDTAQDALASIEGLIGKTMDARTDKDISMKELGKLVMDATDPQEPAPVSEDPDRQFSGSGVSIEDRFPEAKLSDIIADESTAPLSEVDPERRDDEEFLRTGKLPAAETGEGLMSKPLTDDDMGLPDIRSSTEDDISLNKAFVKKMATSEGTTDHVDSLGIPTLGYGVLPATARAYGFDPDSAKYSDRKVLAEDVYDAMYKDANTEYPDVFSNLDESQKIGTLSLYINLGKLPTGVVNALSRDVPDFDAAKDSLASVVLGSPRDKNKKRKKTKDNKVIYTSNKGLSKRRAGEYNTLMEGQAGFKPVHTVSVEGTRQNPVFVWKDSDNNEIHRYTPSITGDDKVYQGLDSSSTMNDVRVD